MKKRKIGAVAVVIGLSLVGFFIPVKVVGCLLPIGSMGSMMSKMMGHGDEHNSQQMDQAQMCPMMGQMPVVGIDPRELSEPESHAAKLYANYCAQCHALPNPKAHSAREWEESFARMDARMQMMGSMKMGAMCMMMNIEAPNEEEKETILSYLKKNGLEEIAKDQLPSLHTDEAKLFETTCTQCHAMPNPSLHTSQEWPEVVDRMQKNMGLMGKRVISEEEKKMISDYLSGNSKKMSASAAKKTFPKPEHKHQTSSKSESSRGCC